MCVCVRVRARARKHARARNSKKQKIVHLHTLFPKPARKGIHLILITYTAHLSLIACISGYISNLCFKN